MYTSAGIPGTGIYAVHHVRSSVGQRASVAESARGFLVGVVVAVVILVGLLAMVASASH